MSEHEIQFGEVEEAQRQRRLRPDRNKQLVVAACGHPRADDLPIFVDLDTLHEMENHALSDTRVELGGVMLGGQFEDETGRPYVVVQDCLRARHYESSKGSFKFTHDTWSDISRRREEFPDELQMVGWYHTHPDWGVFLSGMDMFICDHFFNRPLDVALVIDPCRGDRGFFQWTGQAEQRVRRTDGFYMFASRHRQAELDWSAARIEGKLAMSHDPRGGSPAYPSAVYPVTVTNASDPRSSWLLLGVMGLLGMQFLLLALIAWKLLDVPGTIAAGQVRPAAAVAAAAEESAEQQLASHRAEAQRQLLDRVVRALDDQAPEGVVTMLEQQREENTRLQADVRAYQALEEKLHADHQALNAALEDAQQTNVSLRRRLDSLDRSLAEATRRERGLKLQLDELQEEIAGPSPAEDTGERAITWLRQPWWVWLGGGAVLLVLAGLAYAAGVAQPSRRAGFEGTEGEADAAPTSGDEPEDHRRR